MLVNEIVREQKLDEIAPILGLGAIPMIFSAVLAGMKAMSIYEIYDLLSKNNYDIDNMSEDDKISLFIEFVMLFVPGGGKFTNAVLMKILPDWVKKKGAKMVGDHLLTKAKDLRALKNANRKTLAGDPKKLAKVNAKLDAQYQAVGKQLAAEKLKDVAYNVVGGLALLPMVYTYYGKLDELDKQYAAHKAGDKTTAIFKDMDPKAAWDEYNKLRNKYIGELTIGVTAALSRSPVTKLTEGFTSLVGKLPLVGGLIKLPLALANRVAKVGGPALAVLMQTDEGQKFLSNGIVEVITRGVGSLTSATLDLLTKALDAALGAVGIDANTNQSVKGQEPSPDAVKDGPGRTKAEIVGLTIKSDPKNPKIKTIGGSPVTGPDGFLLNNIANTVQNIKDKASGLGMPNPLDQIPRNPNLQYSY